jgi:hypothetical protein
MILFCLLLLGEIRKYIDVYFNIFFMGCTAHCAYKNMWSGGLCALKIRVIVWKMVAPLQAEIILHCFKTAGIQFCYVVTHTRTF